MKTKQIGEYTVTELTLKGMREIRKSGASEEDIQYLMAARCLTKNGQPLTVDDLDAMSISEVTPLLNAVAEINAPAESGNV